MYKCEKKGVIVWQEVHIIYQEIQNGESRFFNVFSPRALLETAIFALIGLVISFMISLVIRTQFVMIVVTGIFGVIGFVVSSFKIPDSNNF